MKHRFWGGAGSTVFPACRSSHLLCLAANEKDFSLSLEMTNAGKRHFRVVSLLYEESMRRHSLSVLWKGWRLASSGMKVMGEERFP